MCYLIAFHLSISLKVVGISQLQRSYYFGHFLGANQDYFIPRNLESFALKKLCCDFAFEKEFLMFLMRFDGL